MREYGAELDDINTKFASLGQSAGQATGFDNIGKFLAGDLPAQSYGKPEDGDFRQGVFDKLSPAAQVIYRYMPRERARYNGYPAGGSAGSGGPSVEANPSPADAKYKPVLDLIGKAEGTDRGRGYSETLGYGAFTGGPVNLTGMTLDQVDALQSRMLSNPANSLHSSAVGRYQVTQTTLRDLREKYGISGSQLYDEKMQDHLAVLRMQLGGGLTQKVLAGGWASFPDPDTGQSHYGQRVGVSGAEVQRALDDVSRRGALPMEPAAEVPDVTRGGRLPALLAPMTPAPRNAASADNGDSTVRIEIDHSNVPPGVGMTATTQGNGAEIGAIRTRQAMPNAGATDYRRGY